MKTSFFDGADHDAADEIPLYKGVQQDQRQGRHHHNGVFQQLLSLSNHADGLGIQHICHGFIQRGGDGADNNLQRLLVEVLQIDHGGHVVVPCADGGIHDNDGNDRLGQRHHKPDQELYDGAAVHSGGLKDRLRNVALEIVAADDQIECGHTVGDDHDQNVVHQTQLAHQQVGGDHTAAEVHRDQEVHEEHLLTVKPGAGQDIADGDDDQQLRKAHGEGIEQRIPVADPNALGAVQFFISDGSQSLGKQPDLSVGDVGRITDRSDQGIPQGVQTSHGSNQQKYSDYAIGDLICPGLTDFGRMFFLCKSQHETVSSLSMFLVVSGHREVAQNMPVPEIFLDTQLEVKRIIRLQTLLNRSTAVAKPYWFLVIPTLYT